MGQVAVLDEIIEIKRHQRAIVVGRTGSGKTTFSKSVITQFPFVVAMDPKGRFNLPWGRIAQSPDQLYRMEPRPFEPQIYRPERRYYRDQEAWNSVFDLVYRRQNTTLYVDEVEGVIDAPRVPDAYEDCISRGRELNIRVISCNQRPTLIPLRLLTEADHYVMYRLQWEDDVKRMATLMGKEVLEPLPLTEEHAFYYYRVGGKVSKHVLNLPEGGASNVD